MIITQFKSLVNVMFRAFTKQYICDNQIIIYVLCLIFLPDEILYMKPIDKAVDK